MFLSTRDILIFFNDYSVAGYKLTKLAVSTLLPSLGS